MNRIRASYDAVAATYADRLLDELRHKPVDRALLGCFAELTATVDGPVVDVGCGPGHVTRHLVDLGCDARGVDLSPRMIDIATDRFPGVRYDVGSMLELPGDQDWAGAVALYSIIHFDSGERATAYRRLAGAIRPGGWLLVAFHVSDAELAPGQFRHLTDWWDEAVDLDGHFLDPEDVSQGLTGAGFTVSSTMLREPGPEEYPSRRCYLLASR